MQRRFSFFFTVFVLLSIVSALTGPGPVSAQDGQPPTPPSPRPSHPPQDPPSSEELDLKSGVPRSPADLTTQADMAEQLVLGQPGLSLRYVQTFGVTGEPYLADGSHINQPNGLFISGNNLYVAEEVGNRILKFSLANPTSAILTIGHAGRPWNHDDFVSYPRDVAVRSINGHIWIVANPMVKEFDANGILVRTIPPTNPWEAGSDNLHFDDPYGIAFGPNGYLFVSDQRNHRIQIYNVAGANPVYLGTIGTTGVPRSNNSGFNRPMQIAFDGLNRLYVMDDENFRVQRCTSSAPWTNWICSTFFGVTGVEGSDLAHLSRADGLGIDSSNNVYIADGLNYRVLKCSPFGVCSLFAGQTGVPGSDNSHFRFIDDVAVDSAGYVYVSDTQNARIQKFNSAKVYQSTIGVTNVPYVTDATRMFAPWGITVAPDGSIYTVEKYGLRLLKMNSAGVQQWTVGQAGVSGSDNSHFAQYAWTGGPEGNPAVDSNGRIYVSDTHNHRVQIFNPNGTFYAVLGTGWGQGNYQFACPTGVAISPVNGDIYVADHCNQRVQVFTSARIFKATLGQTGVEGSDNAHFRWPFDVKIFSNGSIFVADTENFRVQRCSFTSGTNYTCSTFAGQTGLAPDGTYDHIHPLSIAFDPSGRVYVVDDWNSRVLVYNIAGAFLTTIGGDWSELTGGLIGPSGVAVDSASNVYVTDRENHRIQKFSPGVSGWQQVNINGFGVQANSMITTLGTFRNVLYAGTSHWDGFRAQIWSSANGTTWIPMMTGGFGNAAGGIDHLLEFNGNLYAGTWSDQLKGGEVWRSSNGTTWAKVVNAGFGNTNNAEVYRFQVFNNVLYASTWNWSNTQGGEIWRSGTGNAGAWSKVVSNGFGDPNNGSAIAFEVFGSNLYAGTYNTVTGGEVWRTDTGNAGDWQKVNIDGFGTPGNTAVGALEVFNGYLFAATRHASGGEAEIWRCQVCDNSDWENVTGTWSADSRGMPALEVKSGMLYAVISNNVDGLEVWQTKDGTSWEQIGFSGFEGSNNRATYWDNVLTNFRNELYLGTIHTGGGGQIWRNVSVPITGNVGVAEATLGYSEGLPKTVASLVNGNYSFSIPYNWDGTVIPSHTCFTFSPGSRNYLNVTTPQSGQNYAPTLIPGSGCADIDVSIGVTQQGRFGLPSQGSTRASFVGLNNGPVKIASTNATPLIGAERVIYKVNNVNTSFSEMMGLPDGQLDTTYWLPWYNNVNLDTQLRFANVSGATATVQLFIGGVEKTSGCTPSSSPFDLAGGASLRITCTGVDSGPVEIRSTQNVVAAERVIYKVNGLNTSFSEMMALPAGQLDTTYWLPWYNNVNLDTQLRFGNVSNTEATVQLFIGGQEMTTGCMPSNSPYTLQAGESLRISCAGVNNGPVQIHSNVNIVASERLIYKVNNLNTSFSEMMALPNGLLDTTYWLPWYNNVSLDTQLRFGNVSNTDATVHLYINGVEKTSGCTPASSPFTLAVGQSLRVSCAGVDNGPVQIVSSQDIVAAERVIYKVNGVNTSFSEMMALPNGLLDFTYWLPWYNNVDLDTQLRFGVP